MYKKIYKKFNKKRKGQEFSFSLNVIPTLIMGALTIAVLIWLISMVFKITNDIDTNEEVRTSIAYASALIGNDQLVYNEGIRIDRGVLDEEKLNALIKFDGNGLCKDLKLKYAYSGLSIEDSINGNTWNICDHTTSKIPFSVAIRYNDDKIHMGIMYVSIPKSSITYKSED